MNGLDFHGIDRVVGRPRYRERWRVRLGDAPPAAHKIVRVERVGNRGCADRAPVRRASLANRPAPRPPALQLPRCSAGAPRGSGPGGASASQRADPSQLPHPRSRLHRGCCPRTSPRESGTSIARHGHPRRNLLRTRPLYRRPRRRRHQARGSPWPRPWVVRLVGDPGWHSPWMATRRSSPPRTTRYPPHPSPRTDAARPILGARGNGCRDLDQLGLSARHRPTPLPVDRAVVTNAPRWGERH
ncbi:hypothetical protein CLV40_12971 [Actinokineospora auranticolor]|uniref:Uncharacterized protein n=1 Tax=Actinokineospora auranticolor TaxID=155976 RepID=A0A2S6GDN6_9PSEU|nr:hypothetical protein CLV40_12971 [Actinokineospora auranticolor]